MLFYLKIEIFFWIKYTYFYSDYSSNDFKTFEETNPTLWIRTLHTGFPMYAETSFRIEGNRAFVLFENLNAKSLEC